MTLSQSDRSNSNDNLQSQLAQLNQQLISYRVMDRQGVFTAIVRDIYYDANNTVNLLVELAQSEAELGLSRLESSDICRLNIDEKLVFSNLSAQQLENLPLYQPVPTYLKEALTESSAYNDCEINPVSNDNQAQSIRATPQVQEISLLEEKLQVARRQKKVGEIIVRKEVETRIVKIPIRREKLIVERIGKDPERLTEVIIGEEKVNGFKYENLNDPDSLNITKSHFINLQTAQDLIQAIAHLDSAENTTVRLEIATNSAQDQQQHQDICDRLC